MSKGTITKYVGKGGLISWQLKYDGPRDPVTGARQQRNVTVRGSKKDARKELRRLLSQIDEGTDVKPEAVTLGQYLGQWINSAAVSSLSPKTIERYGQLVDGQIVPHLGALGLQKLRPVHIEEWHTKLLQSGRHDGGGLAARTVGHAHRVLHKALQQAAKVGRVSRNVASIIAPPKVEASELEILSAEQVAEVLAKIAPLPDYPIYATALATGMRRGEILALRWGDVDLDGAKLRVERSLEQTKAKGLRFKAPKTRHGRRSITLPEQTVSVLRELRKRQQETRLALGTGKLPPDALVFGTLDEDTLDDLPRSPTALSKAWARAVDTLELPDVSFHALRHTHASALIAGGVDVLTLSRRLGHASPTITLNIYGHLFSNTDDKAAAAIGAAMSGARNK